MDINNFSDQDLIDLKNKQDEKLVRYLKCYNEATIRTINHIHAIETEINRRKINKISRMYKMKSKRHIKRMKSRLRSKIRRSRHTTRRHKRRGQLGGYAQYQNNMPMTQTYSLGGPLSASLSALASPPPYQVLSNCTNCVDNYNHLQNFGIKEE